MNKDGLIKRIQPVAERTKEGKRMRDTADPVPESRLTCLAPRARRAGGIRDGGCVCIPHISSYIPSLLFSLSLDAWLKTFAER